MKNDNSPDPRSRRHEKTVGDDDLLYALQEIGACLVMADSAGLQAQDDVPTTTAYFKFQTREEAATLHTAYQNFRKVLLQSIKSNWRSQVKPKPPKYKPKPKPKPKGKGKNIARVTKPITRNDLITK